MKCENDPFSIQTSAHLNKVLFARLSSEGSRRHQPRLKLQMFFSGKQEKGIHKGRWGDVSNKSLDLDISSTLSSVVIRATVPPSKML